MKRPNLVYRTVHRLARAAFRLWGSWQVLDLHKIPAEGGVLVAGNHVSYVDPPLIGAAIRRECRFMARHDLWKNRFLAWLLPRLGAYPIVRNKPDRRGLLATLEYLEQGYVVVMFPEGTRSRDGQLQPAEPGLALIVRKARVPVVPAAVIGTQQMMPVGSSRIRRAKLKVIFGDPLFFTPDASKEEICASVMRAIADLLTANGVPTVAAEDRLQASASNPTHSAPDEAGRSPSEPLPQQP
ncbi:MAG: lysophospholipid acyltransferase family protein [Chthonomonadales bacterium]